MSNKDLIAEAELGIRLDKIDKLETLDEKLQLIYEWVKTGHMNLAQFKHMTTVIIVADFVGEFGLLQTDVVKFD